MNEKEKLQRAVHKTIESGYQLNSEAFEFLSENALEKDPIIIINKALDKIGELEKKPLFIDKPLLEKLFEYSKKESKITKNQIYSETSDKLIKKLETPFSKNNTEGFAPLAKKMEAKIKILENPSKKLSSNGTIKDFLQYFQDRFKRIECLLRQRIDVKAATPIKEALKAPVKSKVKIIGMVTEKREVKQQTFFTIEDLEARAAVLVPRKAPSRVHRKAKFLLSDQIVCVEAKKTRNHLFLAEDIILPEIGSKPQRRASESVYAVLTSDIHVGSSKFKEEAFNRFVLWLNGEYGNQRARMIAGQVKYLLIAGDLIDGVGIYPKQEEELIIQDFRKQYEYAAELIKKIPEYIEIVILPGNHDAPRKALPQPAIKWELLKSLQESRRIHLVGNPSLVSLHGVEILMFHGRSLDDLVATIPGLRHDQPEKMMKLLLQSRHLAPAYGCKTMLSPENRDFLVIDRPPDIFHAGHTHVMGYCNHKGVLIVNSGGWQEQTDYMQKLGLVPTPGKVPVINLKTLEITILSFI
ncbi:MAG: DNA-directed DNA polymerase II small subunit [Candidatus Bathyarchaeota archaeon]|nr:DNA-directed DNA polymerase II small subunit [Candidatus Bathyarchaeota archaeon]